MEKESTLIRFNVQNVKYAVWDSGKNTYSSPKAYPFATKLAITAESSAKAIYGDGRKQATILNEKGKTAVLTTNLICNEFELAVGRRVVLVSGVADIKQNKNPKLAIYFETFEYKAGGNTTVAKTWLYGVTSVKRPSESYDQTTEDINAATFETELIIDGIKAVRSDGSIAKDEAGNAIIIWNMTVTPEDDAYSNFENAVMLPTVV